MPKKKKIKPGKYLSYQDNSKLIVVNSFTEKSKVVNPEKNSEQIYSKWLPEENSITLCERNLNKNTVINKYILEE